MTANLLASIFSPAQIAGIVIASIVAAALIGLNILLWYLYQKRQERKLCSRQLQQKRDALLDHLEQLKAGGFIPEAEELDDSDFLDEEEQDNDNVTEEEAEESAVDIVPVEGDDDFDSLGTEILAVKNMSDGTREKLGFVGEEYNAKRYYVRYTLGFEAKLRLSEEEVKERYKAFCNEVALYQGLKIKGTFRQQRIYKGRKTLGLILFRGKTLCVAFALDPFDYVDTKYRGIDKSDKKRFENTPMLFKLTSTRKLEYAKYLLLQLAEANTIALASRPVHNEYELKRMTRDAMFNDEKLRITVLGEVPDDVESNDEPEEILEEVVEEIAPATPDADVEQVEDLDEEELEFVETEEGRMRYDRSFEARIIGASDETKEYYSDLKNYLLSFKKVRCRTSWKHEKFRLGRNCIASFAVRGKTLCLYLALNPMRFEDSKYKVEDYSLRSAKTLTPLLYRIKNDRRLKYAKELIDILLFELDSKKTERQAENYAPEFRPTEDLLRDGLIRLVRVSSAFDGIKKPEAASEPSETEQDAPSEATMEQSEPSEKAEEQNSPSTEAEEKSEPAANAEEKSEPSAEQNAATESDSSGNEE